jgi:hypothetical protein
LEDIGDISVHPVTTELAPEAGRIDARAAAQKHPDRFSGDHRSAFASFPRAAGHNGAVPRLNTTCIPSLTSPACSQLKYRNSFNYFAACSAAMLEWPRYTQLKRVNHAPQPPPQ